MTDDRQARMAFRTVMTVLTARSHQDQDKQLVALAVSVLSREELELGIVTLAESYLSLLKRVWPNSDVASLLERTALSLERMNPEPNPSGS